MRWQEVRFRTGAYFNRSLKTLEFADTDLHTLPMAAHSDDPSERRVNDPTMTFDPSQFEHMVAPESHNGFIGMRYRNHGANWVEMAVPWREDLVGDAETGVLATGPIISLLDISTSMSIWVALGRYQPQVTLDLRIDYLRAATPRKDLIAWAECYQIKRSMAFVRGIAHDGDINDPVANVAGIFIQVETEATPRFPETPR